MFKLLVNEEGSDAAARLWTPERRLTSSLLVYPELRAALAMAVRTGRLDADGASDVAARLEARFAELTVIDLTAELAREAGHLAERHGLRGYGAVHLASALVAEVQLDDILLVTWDEDLARAARRDGLPVAGLA